MPDLIQLNDSLAKLEEELSTLHSAATLIEQAQNSINNLKKITENIIQKSTEATNLTIQEAKKLNQAAIKLFNAVVILLKKINAIDFPTRLDKIDTTVSGINVAVQNTINRLDIIEGNLKSEIQHNFSALYDKTTRSYKTLLILFILLLLISSSALVLTILQLIK